MNGVYGAALAAFASLEVWLLWIGVAVLAIAIGAAIWIAKRCEGK